MSLLLLQNTNQKQRGGEKDLLQLTGPSPFLKELRAGVRDWNPKHGMRSLLTRVSLVCLANFQKLKNKLNGFLSQEGKTRHSQIKETRNVTVKVT